MKKFYLFTLAIIATASLFAQPCSKLFFSEYIEGSGNNKALEIYNPTAGAVNLNGYRIVQYNNGSDTVSYKFLLTGTIAAGDVYVIARDTTQAATADTITAASVMTFNGNDVLALVNGTDTIDRIGQVGLSTDIQFDTTTGKDHSYVRMPNVQEGTLDWNTGKLQWITYPVNTSHLGSHTMTPCNVPLDTLVVFSPTSDAVSMSAGTYNININVNASTHILNENVDVVLTGGTGTAADLNNYTTQTVTFPGNSVNQVLGLTLTQYVSAQPSKTFIFKLRNTTGGLLVGADSVFTLTMNAYTPTGIHDLNDNIARIYPNPNNGNFIIDLKNNTGNAEVKLFDLAGRMVYYTKETSNTIHVNLNQMNAGMYVVEIKTGELISRSKITVQQ